jgi:hypothetical protein
MVYHEIPSELLGAEQSIGFVSAFQTEIGRIFDLYFHAENELGYFLETVS